MPHRVPFPAPAWGGLGVLPASGPVTAGVGRAVPAAVLAATALPTATQRTRGSSPGSPPGPRRGGSAPVDAAAGLARGAAGCDLASPAIPGRPGGPVENRERPGTGTGRLAAVRTGAGS